MDSKLHIGILSICLIAHTLLAQTPSWQWAQSAGGKYSDLAFSNAVDAAGNVYTVGFFDSPTITFGYTVLHNADTINHSDDIFIAKHDANGNALWAKRAGGINGDDARSVAVDASGNVYVTGFFGSDSIVFDSFILHRNGSPDMFLVKYDPSGNVIWAKREGDVGDERAASVAIDTAGNIFIAGYFNKTFTFGSSSLTNAGVGATEVFVLKYDKNGNPLWAAQSTGSDYDYPTCIKTDAAGNCYMSGVFNSPYSYFGTTKLYNSTSSGGAKSDLFIVKYNSNGSFAWAQSGAGSSYDQAYSIAVDGTGNSYLVGNFSSSSLYLNNITLTGTGIFIAKYNSNGNIVWAKSIPGGGAEAVTLDANANLYVAGDYHTATIAFGTTTLSNQVSSGTSFDLFIAKYDSTGNALWAISAGGDKDDEARSLAIHTSGNIYACGDFSSTTSNFGSTTLANAFPSGNNYTDILISKLDFTTGLPSSFEKNNSVSIYPNPTTDGKILITSAENMNTIEVYNILGEQVYRATQQNKNCQPDLSGNPNGIYFIKVVTGFSDLQEIGITQKIIIDK